MCCGAILLGNPICIFVLARRTNGESRLEKCYFTTYIYVYGLLIPTASAAE